MNWSPYRSLSKPSGLTQRRFSQTVVSPNNDVSRSDAGVTNLVLFATVGTPMSALENGRGVIDGVPSTRGLPIFKLSAPLACIVLVPALTSVWPNSCEEIPCIRSSGVPMMRGRPHCTDSQPFNVTIFFELKILFHSKISSGLKPTGYMYRL